jgi:hypothetical protein
MQEYILSNTRDVNCILNMIKELFPWLVYRRVRGNDFGLFIGLRGLRVLPLTFAPRRGYHRVLKINMGFQVTQKKI